MFGKLEIHGTKSVFTADDSILVDLILKPHKCDISSVESVTFTLECNGLYTFGEDSSKVVYYKSDPITVLQKFRHNHRFSCELSFPSDPELPSSLIFDGLKDGICWYIKAVVKDKLQAENRAFYKFVVYVPSIDLPSLPPVFNIIDYEHREKVADIQVTLVTSYSAAGLPQNPLAAGIGLTVECNEIDETMNFCVKRVRFILIEQNEIHVNGHNKKLPTRKWLLENHVFQSSIPLFSNSKLDLDNLTSKIRIKHARIPPTFCTRNITHTYQLNVQVTVEWDGGEYTKRISSLVPVKVLPRIINADLISPEPRVMMGYFDSPEITDSNTYYDSDASTDSDCDIKHELSRIYFKTKRDSEVNIRGKLQRFSSFPI